MCMYAHVCVQVPEDAQKRVSDSHRAGATVSCEPSRMGLGNRTGVL